MLFLSIIPKCGDKLEFNNLIYIIYNNNNNNNSSVFFLLLCFFFIFLFPQNRTETGARFWFVCGSEFQEIQSLYPFSKVRFWFFFLPFAFMCVGWCYCINFFFVQKRGFGKGNMNNFLLEKKKEKVWFDFYLIIMNKNLSFFSIFFLGRMKLALLLGFRLWGMGRRGNSFELVLELELCTRVSFLEFYQNCIFVRGLYFFGSFETQK